jgi:hypothetical protein
VARNKGGWGMSMLRFIVGFFALFFGFTMEPANATSSRSSTFVLSCKGQQSILTLKLDGFPSSSNQIVLGGEIALFENKTEGSSGRSAIQYLVLRAEGDATKHILAMGILQNYAQALFPFDGYKVTADAQGKVSFSIIGDCNQGFNQQELAGIVTIFFQ